MPYRGIADGLQVSYGISLSAENNSACPATMRLGVKCVHAYRRCHVCMMPCLHDARHAAIHCSIFVFAANSPTVHLYQCAKINKQSPEWPSK